MSRRIRMVLRGAIRVKHCSPTGMADRATSGQPKSLAPTLVSLLSSIHIFRSTESLLLNFF
jgi:hypothetical protein